MGGMGGSIIQSGSAILQSVVGRNAINKANDSVQQGYVNSDNALTNQQGVTQGYLAPYSQAGQTALGQMSTGTQQGGQFNTPFSMSQFQQDPGFQFRMQQGQDAINRQTANRGGMLAGSTLGSLAQYSQGLGSQEYQNAFNRYQTQNNDAFNKLGSIAGMGLGASGQQAGYSNQYGQNMAGNYLGAGQAQGAATMADFRNWQTQDSRAAGAWSGGGSGSTNLSSIWGGK